MGIGCMPTAAQGSVGGLAGCSAQWLGGHMLVSDTSFIADRKYAELYELRSDQRPSERE